MIPFMPVDDMEIPFDKENTDETPVTEGPKPLSQMQEHDIESVA